MPIPSSSYPQVIASWPLVADERFDPNQVSPWRANNVVIPTSPEPLQPVISVLFSHEVAAAVYANNASLSNYVFLTSLSDPSAMNVTDFTDVVFDPAQRLLTFRPAVALQAGSRYQATVRGTLADSAGRLLGNSYSWEFDIDPALYQGLPIPVPLSPPDQSVVPSLPLALKWGVDSGYESPPTGQSLAFRVNLYADAGRTTVLWSGLVYANP